MRVEARRFDSQGSFEIRGRRLNISTCPLPGEEETIVLVSDITAQHALQRELGRKTRLSSLGDGSTISASDSNSALYRSLRGSII